MKAISYARYGGPEVLEYGEADDPKLGPDDVLVEVRAVSVNPVDWKARQGHLDAILPAVFPVIPGWDLAGVVVRPGPAVPEFAEGDEVIGYVREDVLSAGTCAEYVAAPVRTLAPKPRRLSFEEAAPPTRPAACRTPGCRPMVRGASGARHGHGDRAGGCCTGTPRSCRRAGPPAGGSRTPPLRRGPGRR